MICAYSWMPLIFDTNQIPVECPSCGAIRNIRNQQYPAHNALDASGIKRKRWKCIDGRWQIVESCWCEREIAMNKPKHVADWENVLKVRNKRDLEKGQENLLKQWMVDQNIWSTNILGQTVQGELLDVSKANDGLLFVIFTTMGNKTIHIQGPYEEFVPVKQGE